MFALLVISMTVAFLLVGLSCVLGEWLDNRRKRPWWREPKRGDVIDIRGRKWL